MKNYSPPEGGRGLESRSNGDNEERQQSTKLLLFRTDAINKQKQ